MYAIRSYYVDVPAIAGIHPVTGEKETRAARASGPFSALAFKVMMDQGRKMTYLRIYSGTLKAGETVFNPGKNIKEKAARLLKMHSNKRERIDQVSAGDIVAAMGLKLTTTGDTLCTEQDRITSYNVCYTKLLRRLSQLQQGREFNKQQYDKSDLDIPNMIK